MYSTYRVIISLNVCSYTFLSFKLKSIENVLQIKTKNQNDSKAPALFKNYSLERIKNKLRKQKQFFVKKTNLKK